eukprot:TRINITY_DN3142_c0_g1_i1.p3 TRINITY_DN3142_c0_g1~~TRINITY_DN3142_c0_g1_i1.p3  ORF type:complete len:116 (+),score=3.38 TRINITY_DN3142_c0_g1_i1:263-610(+)
MWIVVRSSLKWKNEQQICQEEGLRMLIKYVGINFFGRLSWSEIGQIGSNVTIARKYMKQKNEQQICQEQELQMLIKYVKVNFFLRVSRSGVFLSCFDNGQIGQIGLLILTFNQCM